MSKRSKKEEGFPINDFFDSIDYSKYLKAHKILDVEPVIPLPQILTARHPNGHPVYTILIRVGKRKVVHMYAGNQCPPNRAFWKPQQNIEETKYESLLSWQMKLSQWIRDNETQRFETLTFGPFKSKDWRVMLDSAYAFKSRTQDIFPTIEEIQKLAFNLKNNMVFEKFLESVFSWEI